MKSSRQSLGQWGESLAADYLESRGYKILERNVRTAHGEIDLVARDGEMIVFVEVKTRRSTRFGWPEEAVTTRKQEHLIASAQAYLVTHPDMEGDYRFDVIAIEQIKPASQPVITHFEHAFS